MSKFFKNFSLRYLAQKGQGMVEYALILAFIVGIAAYMTSSNGIGSAIKTTFSNVTSTLNNANTNSTSNSSSQDQSTQSSNN
ncbi:MAG: hypothetical protein K6C05_09780 [Anaerovibrio sp.]|uniref:Flp family type IVb pilin n=1 Tax=Anaerovibrio sp. TaxID=1872532 RepID=UPI0025DC4037|nr:hypothetical protein [Anaerovibrio sp.]MCR5177122.1 hypothetical protein [Anaerovibrio sp.]